LLSVIVGYIENKKETFLTQKNKTATQQVTGLPKKQPL